MNKIMLVFGTRPEAIKMCPIVLELKKRDKVEVVVCVTGQHREMLDSVMDIFGVHADYNLQIMKERQTLFDVTTAVLNGLKPILEQEKPDIVLVHGDTSTTFSAALACFYLNIPIGHVEAGLRTYNMQSPFPEEFNRQTVSKLAAYHFAPTETARRNLLKEMLASDKIYVTGNTAIDALKYTVSNDYQNELLQWVGTSRLILLTAHRRENLGEPMRSIFRAVKTIVEEYEDVKVIYPIHMNPAVREIADEILQENNRIRLVEPLDVVDFHNIMKRSYLIMTDSGGVQEEAPSLGIPVLVLRDTTERPEGIEAGTLRLVGTAEEDIYHECRLLLTDEQAYRTMSHAVNPYGDGTAAIRIADIICDTNYESVHAL